MGPPLPHPLFEQDLVPLDTEARPVERGLRIEGVVDEGGDELHVRLRLDESTRDPERPAELAVAEKQRRDDRVVRTSPGLDSAADREARAAALQDDAGARGDDSGAEPLVQALDEGDRHAVTVDGADVDRPR